jgi:Integrase zinc binding domain
MHYNGIYKRHFGYKKTLKLIRRKYFWPEIIRDIKEYVTTYDICQRIHIPRHRLYGKLHLFPIPEKPNQDLFINFITDLLSCKKRENI